MSNDIGDKEQPLWWGKMEMEMTFGTRVSERVLSEL